MNIAPIQKTQYIIKCRQEIGSKNPKITMMQ